MLLRNSRLLIVIYLFESFGNFAPVPTAVRCHPEFAAVRTAVTDAMVTYKASCRSRPLAVRSADIQSPIAAMNCVKKTVTLKGGCEYFPRNADTLAVKHRWTHQVPPIARRVINIVTIDNGVPIKSNDVVRPNQDGH